MQNCDNDKLVEAVQATSACGKSAAKCTGMQLQRGKHIYAETLDTILPVVMAVCTLHRNFLNGIYATAGNAL